MTKLMGCFLVGATGIGITSDGKALIGSVSDDPYDIRTFLRAVKPDKGFAHIGTELVSTTEHSLTERGYFARPGETTRGINQAGLAFTCAMIIEDGTVPPPGLAISYADLTERILKESSTVEEAIAIFKSARRVNPAYTVLLADANGNLAQIEVGNFGVNVNHYYSQNKPGTVFSVNCYVSPALVGYNAPHTALTNKTNNNLFRLERGHQIAQSLKGNIDVSTLAGFLSDHFNREQDPMNNPVLEGWGYSICNHGTRAQNDYSHENLPWGTVSAEIIEPSVGLFRYAYGWPCGSMPEYGDQIYQQNSWGRFLPFAMKKEVANDDIIALTTIEGLITASGVRYLANPNLE